MATPAPEGLDVTDLKFKLQNKVPIFKGDGNVKNGCNLLAVASVHGLVIAGTTGPLLRVLKLSSVTPDKVIDEVVPLRTIPLPSEPFQLATSSDHGFLAVDVIANGVPFIYIYSVASFFTPSVVKLHEIRTSPETGVRSTQILWNPVIHNMFSLRTENGSLSVYTLKEPTGLEFHSLDKSEGAICACWSPKGKQLVVGFANGKLVQYKPDLKPARTIVCPPGVLEGSFDVISLQWLSTYQFAAVFLPHTEDSTPSLFIVNAPKTGVPVFINYDDICYSQSGPRKGQAFLLHILPWNLLLMASANSMEVGILGTTESGETPTWCQWTTTDEARAELPLSADKQETFPVGLALETGCSHRVTVGEEVLPVMPMIHLLSTYGLLVSFNVLNLTPNVPNICSPPRPVTDSSGRFERIDFDQPTAAPVILPPAAPVPKPADITFTVPAGATSTPAVVKTKSFFSPGENKSPMNLFGSGTSTAATIAPSFGKQINFGGTNLVPAASTSNTSVEPNKTTAFGSASGLSFGAPTQTFVSQPQAQSSLLKTTLVQPQPSQPKPAAESTKPLVTVPPTYTAPPPADIARSGSSGSLTQQTQKPPQKKSETDDTNTVIRSMITEEIRKFEKELSTLQSRCRSQNIAVGTKEDSGIIIRNLKELQDLSIQAAESTDSLTSDVQALRLGLNEAFAMVAEANSKSSIFKHPSPNQFPETHAMSQSCRRQLTSLQNMLAINENQLQIVNKQIDAQWAAIQEANQLNSKRRMHVPSLEVLYQTLSKQQEILNRQRDKLSYIKGKLGMRECIRGLEKNKRMDITVENGTAAIDSLTDSIVSMNIVDQVREDARRLNEAKMDSLRNTLRRRNIVTIKPGRPDRVGLNSEVVRERRNEVRRLNQEKEKTKVVIPVKKQEEPPKIQQKPTTVIQQQPKPVLAKQAEAPAAKFELPKTALPSFAPKPSATTPAAAAPAVQPAKTTSAGAFSFTAPQSSVASTSSKSSVVFGTGSTAAGGSVFSFGQAPQPFVQTSKPKEPDVPKETTLFGSTTIKPVSMSAANDPQTTKEKSEPPSSSFGFGSTTIQAIPKVQDKAPPNPPESAKSVLSFASNNNNSAKPTTFSFGAVTSEPVTFGSAQPAPAPVLNLTTKNKENEPKKEENPKIEAKTSEPQPTSSGSLTPSEDSVRNTAPTLTKLLQKVEPVKQDSPPSGAATTTASSIFGTSTATIAPGTGLFGSIKTPPAATTVSAKTIATSTTTASTGFSFGAFGSVAKPTDLSVKSEEPKTESKLGFVSVATTVPATTTAAVVAIASSTDSTVSTTVSGFSFGTVVAPTTTVAPTTIPTTTAVPVSSTDTTSTTNLFGSFNICSPSTPESTKQASANIFSSTSFSTPKTETTSIFGGGASSNTSAFGPVAATADSKPSNIFGSATPSTNATTGTGLFGAVTSNAGASIFGASSATPQSPSFGTAGAASSGGNLFGAVAATSPTAAPTGTGSIFGGASSTPFGAAAVATPSATPASTNIFGGASTTASSGGGFFGTAAAAPAAGGSLFSGTSTFGSATTASSGNIFGSPSVGASTGGFGSSAFGQPSSPQPAQSIFGGASNTSGFGSGGFGSPSAGAFSQAAGGSVAQTGFGSPNASAFNKPTFGGAPTFGAAPTFGGAPAFGSPPAFGSKPAFGSGGPVVGGFGQATLSPSTQSNSLFEQLGSSSTEVSFGNLAQQSAQKPPQFGGSSFSSWR